MHSFFFFFFPLKDCKKTQAARTSECEMHGKGSTCTSLLSAYLKTVISHHIKVHRSTAAVEASGNLNFPFDPHFSSYGFAIFKKKEFNSLKEKGR